MTTKELLASTGVSEATLRRWIREGQPVPELVNCKRDWRGWRTWEIRHLDAIRSYQQEKQRQHDPERKRLENEPNDRKKKRLLNRRTG